jgi:cytochrome c556
MKKILVAAVLLGSVMLMAEQPESNEAMKKTMQNMEISMAFIQKGFLYNHKGRIKKGITSLRRELKNIDSFVIKNDKSINFNAHEYAQKETKALDLMAARILPDFDAGKKEAVMIDFQQMLNRCVTCHALVRKW